MEQLSQNGSVVMNNQSQRQSNEPPSPITNFGNVVIPDHREILPSDAENYQMNQHMFMQENKMEAWYFDSINEDPPINTEALFHPSTAAILQRTVLQPEQQLLQQPIPAAFPSSLPTRKEDQMLNTIPNNFAYFANHSNAGMEQNMTLSSIIPVIREITMVDSCDTPVMMEMTYTDSETNQSTGFTDCVSLSTARKAATYPSTVSTAGKAATASGLKEKTILDITMTSSDNCSSESNDSLQRKLQELELKTKKKSRVSGKSEFQEGKKQVPGSTPKSTKRSRAAEIHNLSERKRRDRINEKMKALQELIPHCDKTDRASMLDEVIEYVKSLELKVQMLSMEHSMIQMMFPEMQQQYMPAINMGMGMRLGMEMAMNRPVMPFPNILPNSPLPPPTTTVATPNGPPRFPMPPFHMPHVPNPAAPESSLLNHSGHLLDSFGNLLPDRPRIPNTNYTDPYQQFLDPHRLQKFMQGMNQKNVSRPGSSAGQDNPEKHQEG